MVEGGATAVSLNGRDGRMTAEDNPSQSGMKSLTIHARFKLNGFPRQQTALVRKWGPLFDAAGPEDDSFTLDVNESGKLWLQVQNGKDLGRWGVGSEALPVGQWVEVVAVYDGQRNRLYVRRDGGDWQMFEGFLIPTQVRAFLIRDTGEPVEMGCDPHRRSFLNVAIDWVRIYADAWDPR
ncbi:MAG: LamG domain-containing protein [Planctomycetota bacterium]